MVEHLRCAGLIEAVTVSRAAYPYRLTHVDVFERFGDLRVHGWYDKFGAASVSSKCTVLLEDIFAAAAAAAPVSTKSDSTVAASTGSIRTALYEVGRTKVRARYFSLTHSLTC